MLNKIKFPFKNVESIVERRGGMEDFTCQTKNQTKQLAAALECHSDVQFARLVRSDYTDVKIHWIPGRFPNQKIVAAIERHHGKVYEHRILKDRYGIADGRRLYRLKTDDLKQHPIAPTVRMDEMVFLVQYSGQPAQCFLCKGFGHLRYDCPNAVTTPTISEKTSTATITISEQRKDSSMEEQQNNQQPEETIPEDSMNASDIELDRYSKQLEDELFASAPTRKEIPAKEKGTTSAQPATSSTGQENNRNISEASNVKHGNGSKRTLSPDSSTEEVSTKKLETEPQSPVCPCGERYLQPLKVGAALKCACERFHIRCICNKIFSSKENNAAHCSACQRLLPVLDFTF